MCGAWISPDNKLGLNNDSQLVCLVADIRNWLHLEVDEPITITFDGQYVRYKHLDWSIERLTEEIEKGIWRIV